MPVFSFVVIAYNVEQYIAECLQSLKEQTLSDCEVIVVDDASTDNTKSIIQSVIEDDARFTLIAKEHNQGAHLARKTGVAASHGKYVVLVDGDDKLYSTAGEVLSAVAGKRQFDILRFGRSIIPCGQANEERAFQEERSFNLATGPQRDDAILRSVFSDHEPVRNSWSLIDCLFDGDFVRSGFASMTGEWLGRMEDAYEFFVLASRARTMMFFTEYHGLRYRLGSGDSGWGTEELSRFERGQVGICSSLNAVMHYAEHSENSAGKQCAQWFQYTVYGIVGRDWSSRLTIPDQAAAISSLRTTWGDAAVSYMMLDPLTARAQWFVDNNAIPSDEDPYTHWLSMLDSLELDDVQDRAIADRIEHFRSLEKIITDRRTERDRAVELQRQQEEQRRLEEEQRREQERIAQLERQIEAQRLWKTGSWQKRVIDKVLPESGRARAVLRSLAHVLLRR